MSPSFLSLQPLLPRDASISALSYLCFWAFPGLTSWTPESRWRGKNCWGSSGQVQGRGSGGFLRRQEPPALVGTPAAPLQPQRSPLPHVSPGAQATERQVWHLAEAQNQSGCCPEVHGQEGPAERCPSPAGCVRQLHSLSVKFPGDVENASRPWQGAAVQVRAARTLGLGLGGVGPLSRQP